MGTSGAYGGSPGFKPVSDSTQNWLDSGGGTGGGDGNGHNRPVPDQPVPPTDGPPPAAPPPAPPAIGPRLVSVLAALGRVLSVGPGGGGGGGGMGGGQPSSGSGRRSVGRASAGGGRAIGGAYGARAGVPGPLTELGLNPSDLIGLPKHEQARRILEAAIGPSGDVFESELRQACAEVILWALTEEVEPPPIEMTNRFVVEYVWQVWVTEEGSALQQHTANGYDRTRAEQEMRAALEATVVARGLPTDRPLTTADFSAAINGTLLSLRRIAGTAA